jgi:serine/threonine protein kinase
MNVVNNKYKIINKIGSGSFGSIYKGQNIRTKEYIAIKIEPIKTKLKLLKNESLIYQHLKGCDGIPNIKWFGKDDINYYMVIDLLGISLQDLKNKMHKFSLPLVLKIGIKVLSLLKTIHDKGIIHRDIKPDNFLFSTNKLNTLYLIDFGLCKFYTENDIQLPLKKTNGLIGSFNYASLMSHNRLELSRRDDLESVVYMLLYLLYGFLPWNDDTDENIIIQKKSDLIKNKPNIILDLLSYARNLNYEETPNYFLIMNNLKKEISKTS